MAKLEYSVYVAPSKLVASDDFPPGEDREMWSPTASTLIHGERDAVLVDPLMTKDESRALAAWVVATGKNVTAIFVTHAHGDHFFGAPAVLERFPDAKVVAGHKRDGDADSPENIGKTRRYIEDFSAAVEKAHNFTGLYEAMVAVYPGRVNRAVIWHSAKAFLA